MCSLFFITRVDRRKLMYKHDFLRDKTLMTAAGSVKFDKNGLAKEVDSDIKAELDKLPDVKEVTTDKENTVSDKSESTLTKEDNKPLTKDTKKPVSNKEVKKAVTKKTTKQATNK